jgi:cytochrome c553
MACACSAADEGDGADLAGATPLAGQTDERASPSFHAPEISGLPDANSSRPTPCDRAGDDVVRDLFCGDEPANVRSLSELLPRLQLHLSPDDAAYQSSIERGIYSSMVLLSHSTSLPGALVSALNPRAIVMNYNVFVAFNRGVQQAEIIARDRSGERLNFYLLSFNQACNANEHGCSFGDLYTPRIESDWEKVALQDDEELKNTPSDCRQCHQRGSEKPQLLMRELQGPWTHFFGPEESEPTELPFDEPSGSALLRDYLAAKDREPYAGLSTDMLRVTIGFTLQNYMGFSQPLLFDGSAILNERWPWRPEGYFPEPQRSPTWADNYAAFKRGEQLALPFYAPRAADMGKQAQLTAAYRSYLRDELAAEDLPDLSDTFSDDLMTRAELGLQTEPGATPAQALVQACGTCHNDVLDQSISRARFSVALGRLNSAELKLASARLKLPRGSAYAMPPGGARQVDAAGLAPLIQYLERNQRGEDDDALLEHAAQVGMNTRSTPPSFSGAAPRY